MNNENNIFLAIIIALLVFLILGGVGMMSFNSYGGMYGMMNRNYTGFESMFVFSWLVMILVVIALVLFILWLIKQITGSERRNK